MRDKRRIVTTWRFGLSHLQITWKFSLSVAWTDESCVGDDTLLVKYEKWAHACAR